MGKSFGGKPYMSVASVFGCVLAMTRVFALELPVVVEPGFDFTNVVASDFGTAPIQYLTPSGTNSWVGDVTVCRYKDRFHVFYLYDEHHHQAFKPAHLANCLRQSRMDWPYFL